MKPLVPLLGIAVCGCSASWYAADADREVGALLDQRARELDRTRRADLVRPEQDGGGQAAPEAAGPEGDPSVLSGLARDEGGRLVVDLERALWLGVTYNRGYKTRRDSLYRQGLGYSLTRFDFGPQFRWAVASVWSDQELAAGSGELSQSFGVSQILPTGGSIALSSALVATRGEGAAGRLYTSSAGVTLTQPLLRGRGYEVSHESLTQAERELSYAVRDFELFREQFSIDIAEAYFALLSQKKTLANEERNYQQARFDRQKAEALEQVGRQKEQEVFRARRRELLAENDLVDARADFDRAVDQFEVSLGLPTTTEITLVDEEPPFEKVELTPDSAVEAARHNRLDLITERQRIADAERRVRIAGNGVLPDLELVLDYGLAGSDTTSGGAWPDEWAASAALTLEIPLQRTPERNRYRDSLIELAQARRGYRDRLDQLEVDIRDQIRRLRSIETQIVLQEEQIVQEQRAVTVSEIRFEAGDLDNRDLLEARQALVDAQNALIRLKADHFIRRLTLLRSLGLLFIDGRGMWQ